MRRSADLHPGNAKTDARDAYVIAEAARTMPHTQGKKHNAALICLARRRCDVLYAMLKQGTPYQTPAPAAV